MSLQPVITLVLENAAFNTMGNFIAKSLVHQWDHMQEDVIPKLGFKLPLLNVYKD